MMAVAEAGGDDYEDADEEWIVYTQPSDLMAVKKALEEQGVQVKGAEMTMEATTPATGHRQRRQEGHAPRRQAGGA